MDSHDKFQSEIKRNNEFEDLSNRCELDDVVKNHLNKGIEIEEPAIAYDHMPSVYDKVNEADAIKQKHNFDFLKDNPDFADLYTLCHEAEICQLSDPSKSALSCRRALEFTTKAIYLLKGFHIPERASLFELVDSEEFKGFINDDTLMKNLHYIRKAGNNAAHLGNVSRKESFFSVLNLHNFVGSVLMMLDVIDTFPRFDRSLLTLQKEIYVTPKSDVQPNPVVIKKYEEIAEDSPVLKVTSLPQYFTEAETRALYIDQLLKEAGWQIATEKNVFAPNMVGLEISTEGMPNSANAGYIDYVIYGSDGKPLAVIEAKKTSVDPSVGKHQAELYADCLEAKYGVKPIIYYTNGYEIYCIDRLGYPPRRVYGFHSRANLELLIQRQKRKQITDLRINDEITNREYQKRGITAICEHLNSFNRRGLLVMATGTGKTRVSISLVDVLIRNNWVKNALFLADRTALVKQAMRNFSKLLPHVTTSALSDNANKPDKNARILFSTYQTMINFIDADTKEFSVGRFDLIIIDEAHRSIFGKYMSIFNYFDSFLIGLTATPRDEVDKSTYQTFHLEQGEPNFDYELEEAVADNFLVPYQVINRRSKILSEGIKYDDLTEDEKEQIEKVYEYEIENDNLEVLLLGRRDFNPREMYNYLFNNDTVDKVLQDLMTNGLKIEGSEKIGKTIVFAYNHKHAQQIVDRFYLLYPQYGHNFCVLIDNTVKYAQNLIDNFEQRDNNPQIAVSVDMLDTGIDVPDILNLVFFKGVKSKIKFQQMIGRGTRLSKDIFGPDLDKKQFLIFDYCGNFEYFNVDFKEKPSVRHQSLTEKLFNLKLDISIALQDLKYQEDEYLREFCSELKLELQTQVSELNRNHIDVRNAWQLVDKYSADSTWEYISAVDGLKIRSNISPLLPASLEEENSKRFDLIMLLIELSLLDEEVDSKKNIEAVVAIAQALQKKVSIPQVRAKLDVIKEVQTVQFWEAVSVPELERVRMELRGLMMFIDSKESQTFIIDIEDELTDGGEVGKPRLIVSYKQKVLEYLSKNSDSPVIQKIKNLEQLTANDIRELEKVLWVELGSKDDYEKHIGNKMYGNVAVFLRSLVGIDRETALQKFSKFMDTNLLNSAQLEYLKYILDYVSVNGDISGHILANKEPFNEFNWLKVYGNNTVKIKSFIEDIHGVITA
ncbi:MAG: DEAD/DEAH box helicase family protein [Fermentimonas sp.]|nr:DEAD/DEAH box helicase family protein [Fermentimonas sp.]